MKRIPLAVCLVVICFGAGLAHAKLKQLCSWQLNHEEYDDYAWNAKGILVVNKSVSNGPNQVTVYKKDKQLGTGTIPESADADCAFAYDFVGSHAMLYKVRKGEVHSFYVYTLGKQLKKQGEFQADTSGDECCPNFYCIGKKLYFKQRQDNLGNVELRTFNSKLKQKLQATVQAGDSNYNGCVWLSPHGKYGSVERSHDDCIETSMLDVYKIGKKPEKLAEGISSRDFGFEFHGKSDKIVSHIKDATAPTQTLEVARLGSYTPLHEVELDDSVSDYRVEGKGNVVIVFTNGMVSLVTRKGTLGPFQAAELQGRDFVTITWFKGSCAVFCTRTDLQGGRADFAFHAYKISRKGLRALSAPLEFPDYVGFQTVTYEKSIYCCANRDDEYAVTVFTPRLKTIGTLTCQGEDWPAVINGALLDRVYNADTIELYLHTW